MFKVDAFLLLLSGLTVLLETPCFYLSGFHRLKSVLAFVAANVISNLLLNEALPEFSHTLTYYTVLAIGEVLVIFLEFALMLYVESKNKEKLFKTICFSNALSLTFGVAAALVI